MTENPSPLHTLSRSELRQSMQLQLPMLLDQGNLETAKALLIPVQPVDIAGAIEDLPETIQGIAFRLLPKNKAIQVYEYLDHGVQQSLIQEFKSQEVLDIVEQMSPDDRAQLFDELPAQVISRLLEQLSPEEQDATAQLLGYEVGTAGRIMTPEYISLKEDLTVTQALEQIRTLAPTTEIIYYLYVTDAARSLGGIVSLRDLVTAQPHQTLGEIMNRDVVFVHTYTRQEEVARTIQRYDFLAVPVVDREEHLVGIVTVDDVIDILEQETTKDIYELGGVQSGGDSYFQTNLMTAVRKRVVWLLILLLTNTVTGSIIKSQQDILQQVVTLAAFIPLLTGTGGNVGAQSSTVVIRGLNTDEIQAMGSAKIIFREAIAGVLLGVTLGSLATVWAFWLQGNWVVSIAVGVSLVAIALLASVAGSALPFLFRSLGLDPALMSAPFITTAVDVLGVLIYFNIARLILHL